MPVFGVERERELGFQGVYRIPPGGGDPSSSSREDEFEQPNGLCFSPDESLLYVNDTPSAHIKVFDVGADGTLSNGRMFFEGIGSGVIEEGIPRRDEVRRARQHLGHRPRRRLGDQPGRRAPRRRRVPENVGNLTWGGPDWTRCSSRARPRCTGSRRRSGRSREPYMR